MNFNDALPKESENPSGLSGFDSAPAAPSFMPIPGGIYAARILRGEVCKTRAGEDAYKIRFEIAEGEHAGQKVSRTWTFSAKAMPYTKRDLATFGLVSSAALLAPFPQPGREYLCRLTVALQSWDDGTERNDVKRIDLLKVTDSPAAKFMLPGEESEGGNQ